MNELQRLLKPLKYKLLFERFCQNAIFVSIFALIAGIVIAIAGKWWDIIGFGVLCMGLIMITMIVASVLVVYPKKLDDIGVAQAGDSLGYEERFVTAMEILNKGEVLSVMEEMAIEDGLLHARNNNLAKAYHINLPKRFLKVVGILCIGYLIVGFIDSPKQREVEHYADAYLKRVEQVEISSPNLPKLNKTERKQWNQVTDYMQKNIKKARSKEAVDQEITNAQQEMKKMEKASVNQDLKSAGDVLAGNQMTQKLGTSMQQGDGKKVSNAIEEMMKTIPAMSQEEKEQLAELFQNTADSVSSQEFSGQFNDLASQLTAENIQAMTATMSAMKQQISQMSQQGATLRQAVTDFNQNMAQAIENQNQSESLNTVSQKQSSQTNQQSDGSGGNQAQSQGSGQGQGNEQSQGSGQGQGNEQSQGSGQGNGQGQGGGQGRGKGHIESEKIYTRKEQGKAGYDTQLQGTQNESGQTSYSAQQIEGTKGESVPYQQVFESYKQEALRDIDNENVPFGMREIVSEYFSSLEK